MGKQAMAWREPSQGDRLVRLLETSSVVQGWTEGPDPAWGGGEGEAGKSKSREG